LHLLRFWVAVYTDDSARRRLNLAFFIVSLYSCLFTLVPLLYLLPVRLTLSLIARLWLAHLLTLVFVVLLSQLFASRRQHSKLGPLFHVLLILSSLSILAIAALQIVLYKLWEGEPAPRGFVGRCGWDMDAVWGAPTTCGTYRWDGWVGVLTARFAGSFILIVSRSPEPLDPSCH
jgi:hypothetical protein